MLIRSLYRGGKVQGEVHRQGSSRRGIRAGVTRALAVTVAGYLVAAAPSVLMAQDAERVAPKMPGDTGIVTGAPDERPGAVQPGEQMEQLPPTAGPGNERPGVVQPGEQMEQLPETAGPGAERPGALAPGQEARQLLSSLQGLVFVTSRDQVQEAGVSGVHGVQSDTNDVLATTAFDEVAQKYIGQPVSLESLNQLNRDVVAFYSTHDYPVVDVVIPEQDITGGVVQLIVLKGHLGTVTAQGNEHFSDKLLTSQISMHSGDEIRASALRSDVEWLNRNPFRHVDLVYSRGEQTGETNVELRTRDRRPYRVYGGYEDSGNHQTGDNRWLLGFNWGNVWGLDHQLNYQYTFNNEPRWFKAHSGTYIAPLPWHHLFSVFASYSELMAKPGTLPGGVNGLDLRGRNWQISPRYTVPLPRLHDYTHEVAVSYDLKRSNNNLEFGGTQVRNSDAMVSQFNLNYSGSLPDEWGRTSFTADIYYAPGGMMRRNSDKSFEEFRDLASADYMYARFQAQRVQRLPYDYSLIGKITGQMSSTNLLGSEQLGAGGYATVRGYEERAVNADEGVILNLEVRTPPISLLSLIGQQAFLDEYSIQDQFQALLFWDYARMSNHDLKTGEPGHKTIASIGPGLRYDIPPYLSLRFDYGFQLEDPEVGSLLDRHRGSRMDLGILLSY